MLGCDGRRQQITIVEGSCGEKLLVLARSRLVSSNTLRHIHVPSRAGLSPRIAKDDVLVGLSSCSINIFCSLLVCVERRFH